MTQTERKHGGTVPRYLAILVAAVLGLSLFPATAFAGHNPNNVDPCAGAPVANEYVDRSQARDVHEPSIDCVIFRSISVGTSNAQGQPVYQPLNPVTRGQMASFIYNTLDAAGYGDELPTREGADEFDDISGTPARGDINALARAGIVRGRDANTFDPSGLIERDEMASFMVQAANWAVGEEDQGARVNDHPVTRDGADRFTDVPDTNVHKGNIEAGADAGLFQGVTATQFDPNVNVLRDQMATFLVRLLKYIFNAAEAPAATTVQGVTVDGRTVTGELTGAESATVSGCGLANDTAVTDTDTTTDDNVIEFEIQIPDTQPAGQCTLTFEITRPNGQVVIRSVSVTVEGGTGNEGATDLPELVSAEVTEVDTAGADAGATICYTFDEPIELAFASEFLVYEFDGTQYQGDEIDEEEGDDDADEVVCVLFPDVDTQDIADSLSVATVEFAAVQDVDNDDNPIGDAPLGDEDGGETTLPAGETDAPDLTGVDVQDEIGNDNEVYEVIFTFDENVESADTTPGAFLLILEDGTEIECTAVDANPDDDEVETECGTAGSGEEFEPADVARGVVRAGAVEDEDGDTNPLQAEEAEGDDGNTEVPDLVEAEFFPSDDTDDDQVAFTFDEPVECNDAGAFLVYDTEGNEIAGTDCENDTSRVILVDFPDESLEEAVGASVEDGAVIEDSLDARPNQEDEEGVENTEEQTAAGFTDGPDLIEVNVEEETSATGTVTGVLATYTFDEDVETLNSEEFFLHTEDGTRYQATECDIDNDGDEPTVECTEFEELNEAGGVEDADPDDEDVLAAVIGTVDDQAVSDDDGDTNPEGAELVTDA